MSKPLNKEIFNTSAFYFSSMKETVDAFEFKNQEFVYSRGNNPTVRELERELAKLEKGADAVCFASGMAAISTVMFSLLQNGDTFLSSSMLYGSTKSFFRDFLPNYGINGIFLDFSKITKEELERVIKDNLPKVVYIETPSNPVLETFSVEYLAGICKKFEIKFIVDNSLLSPIIQRPLDMGADIVIESLTKHISGHGNTLGGVAISNDVTYIHKLKFNFMCELGGVLNPEAASMILSGIQTLKARIRMQQETTQYICEELKKKYPQYKVLYPHPFEKEEQGVGSVFSLILTDFSEKEIFAFIDALKLFKISVSFGEVHSLVCYPRYMTHRSYIGSEEEKELKHLVRFSIGLEDKDELLNDINAALIQSINVS